MLIPGGMMDVRRMTKYLIGELKPDSRVPNDVVDEAIEQYPTRFKGFVCVNPHDGETCVEDLEAAVRRGRVGLKLAPAVHGFAFDAPIVKALAARCGELGVPLYSHVTLAPGARTDAFAQLVESFPRTSFILGHMGQAPADEDAISLAAGNANLFLETSGGSFITIEMALTRLGPGKLIFGSEAPLNHPAGELSKIRLLPSSAFDQITSKNISALLG